jgi:starch-binding outer membrane protein, SusD/RagB family
MKTKKAIKSIILVPLILLTAACILSCSSVFEVDPSDTIREGDFYKNREDLNASAIGMYQSLAQEVHKFLLWGDARADMVAAGQHEPDPYINEFVVNNVTVNNPYTNYAGIYRTIARCNRQMEKVYDVQKLDSKIADRDAGAFYGEALLLRAVCYYELVRTYAKFPVITSDYAEKITYINSEGQTVTEPTPSLTSEQISSIYKMPKDQQEVWTLIYNDVLTALGMLPVNYQWNDQSLSAKERYGRVSQPLAATLAAEVALWLGEYQTASSLCDLPIKNSNQSLGTSGTWFNQFSGGYATGHSMFLLGYQYENSFETNRLQEFTSSVRNDGGRYYLKPVAPVVDRLFTDDVSLTDADIRAQASYKVVNGDTVIWKYIGMDNVLSMRPGYQSSASWSVIRSADAYLIKATADLMLNNYASAFNFINMVRTARGLVILDKTKFDYTNRDVMDKLIFDERAREFAFEGRRWYDLMLQSKLKGKNMLADAVAAKYPVKERAIIKARLEDQKNWYIPVNPKLWE